MNQAVGPVVVGIAPSMPELVLREAAALATDLGTSLVTVYVDASQYVVARDPGGLVTSAPFDPDLPELEAVGPRDDIAEFVAGVLAPTGIEFEHREVVGEPAVELARVAEDVHARLIVVGTREPGVVAGVREFFTGSVAVGLAHHQHRPVVVVPQSPRGSEDPAPWE